MASTRKWTAAEEATFVRARRPWLALYEPATRRVPLPRPGAPPGGVDGALSAPAPPPVLALVLQLLGPDALLEVFLRLPPRSVCRAAAVCRQWRAVAEAQPLWRAACLAVPAWGGAGSGEGAAGVARMELYCDRFHCADWRAMYTLRPHLRTDGIYVSRNTYLRRGMVELRSRVPIHIVCYFRYLAFHPNGTFLYRTTPSPPSTQRVLARPRAALRTDGVLSGELHVSADGAGIHTVITYAHGRLSHLHTWLRLRSTRPGANNRLDVRSMVSVDDGTPAPPEPDVNFDAYNDESGLGWHAAHGGLGGWNGGEVRTHGRGLTPYVFVHWDDLDCTELNLGPEHMDYFVPG